METLAPREAYDEDEIGITRNMPLFMGLPYGIIMGVFELIEEIGEGSSPGEVVGMTLFTTLFAGVFFGFFFGGWMKWSARRVHDHIYAGDPRVVAPPPPGYPFRLPCGLMHRPGRAVAGVLYLGPPGLRFHPHRRGPKAGGEPLVIEPLERVEIKPIDAPVPAWMRIFGTRTVPRVEVRWPEGRAELDVPTTDATFRRLREGMDALRGAGPTPEAA